jgi:hypothetical protein
MAALFDFPLECAANVDSAVARCDWPQLGQAIASPLRTSFSNLVPQSSQTYSKIGILRTPNPPCSVCTILAHRGREWGWREGSQVLADLVTYLAKESEAVNLAAVERGGILERVMKRNGSGEEWAIVFGVIANS